MSGSYLYNVEFSVDDYDLWNFPKELNEELPTIFRFKMNPSISLEITDDEFCDQINSSQKLIKNTMFSLDEHQLKGELGARFVFYKLKCLENEVKVASYKFKNFESHFNHLKETFDKQSRDIAMKPWKPVHCGTQPCTDTIRELVQLVNEKNEPTGSLYYMLRLTCFGPSFSKNQADDEILKNCKAKVAQDNCLDQRTSPSTCHSKSQVEDSDYQEYSAAINGNHLIVRVRKDDCHRVTRVFDANMDQDGHEIKSQKKNFFSLCGCDQQIDFQFPENFSCANSKKKPLGCDCGPNSMLTDFQRQTSCIGKSFKNSCALPVIRGNLKYPGRIVDGMVNFDLYDKSNLRDVTEKYIKSPACARGVCLQVDRNNLQRELEGKCKLPKGIEVCKKGCSDPDTDVFILKIGSKKTDKKGRKNEIELEMRTPKAPDFEVKKMETREIQVDEKDLQDSTKQAVKKPVLPATTKGFVKRTSKTPIIPKKKLSK